MPTPGTKRTVLCFCPPDYKPDQLFHFVNPVAEYVSGIWVQLTSPSTQFPVKDSIHSRGAVFADIPTCYNLKASDIVAFEIERQPFWKIQGLSAEYRAVAATEMPYELLAAELPSNSPDVREYLTETGVWGHPSRPDGEALVQFQDGVVAKLRVVPHPSAPNRMVVPTSYLRNMVEAWPTLKGNQVLTVSVNGKPRRFLNTGGPLTAPDRLDWATLDEAFEAARGGGIGDVAGVTAAELKKAREKLEQLLRTFPGAWAQARLDRIKQFLDQAGAAAATRQAFIDYLATHPAFGPAVDEAAKVRVATLTDQLRSDLLGQERELAGRLAGLNQQIEERGRELAQRMTDYDDIDRMVQERERDLAPLTEQVATLTRQRDELTGQVEEYRRLAGEVEALTGQQGEAAARVAEHEREFRRLLSEIETAVAERDRLNGELEELRRESGTRRAAAALEVEFDPIVPVTATAREVKTVTEAVALVRENLTNLGLSPVTAANIAVEAVAAAGLGQILLTRGSLAALLGEVLAVSLGAVVRRVPVRLGATDPYPIEVTGGEPSAVLLDGANLSCPDAYAGPLQRLVQRRSLFPDRPRFPVVVATLCDGPSSLPPAPQLVALGPVFDTDHFNWPLRTPKSPSVPGRCAPAVWQVPDGDAKSDGVLAQAHTLVGRGSALWQVTVRAAFRRLSGMVKSVPTVQPEASVTASWLIPWLAANLVTPPDHADAILGALTTDRAKSDPRVLRALGRQPGGAE